MRYKRLICPILNDISSQTNASLNIFELIEKPYRGTDGQPSTNISINNTAFQVVVHKLTLL